VRGVSPHNLPQFAYSYLKRTRFTGDPRNGAKRCPWDGTATSLEKSYSVFIGISLLLRGETRGDKSNARITLGIHNFEKTAETVDVQGDEARPHHASRNQSPSRLD